MEPLLVDPPFTIPASETLISQGNMIQGTNLECAERNIRLCRTGPSFQVIPRTKTQNIYILQVKFLPLRDAFFTQFFSLTLFPHQNFTVEQKAFQGATKLCLFHLPGRGDCGPCTSHIPEDGYAKNRVT